MDPDLEDVDPSLWYMAQEPEWEDDPLSGPLQTLALSRSTPPSHKTESTEATHRPQHTVTPQATQPSERHSRRQQNLSPPETATKYINPSPVQTTNAPRYFSETFFPPTDNGASQPSQVQRHRVEPQESGVGYEFGNPQGTWTWSGDLSNVKLEELNKLSSDSFFTVSYLLEFILLIQNPYTGSKIPNSGDIGISLLEPNNFPTAEYSRTDNPRNKSWINYKRLKKATQPVSSQDVAINKEAVPKGGEADAVQSDQVSQPLSKRKLKAKNKRTKRKADDLHEDAATMEAQGPSPVDSQNSPSASEPEPKKKKRRKGRGGVRNRHAREAALEGTRNANLTDLMEETTGREGW